MCEPRLATPTSSTAAASASSAPRTLTVSFEWSALNSDPTSSCHPHSSRKSSVSDRYPALSRRAKAGACGLHAGRRRGRALDAYARSRGSRPATAGSGIEPPCTLSSPPLRGAAPAAKHAAALRQLDEHRGLAVVGRLRAARDGRQVPAGRLRGLPRVVSCIAAGRNSAAGVTPRALAIATSAATLTLVLARSRRWRRVRLTSAAAASSSWVSPRLTRSRCTFAAMYRKTVSVSMGSIAAG